MQTSLLVSGPVVPEGWACQWALRQRRHWIPWLFLCPLSLGPLLHSAAGPFFLSIPFATYVPFLLPFTSLTSFKPRQALAFKILSLHTEIVSISLLNYLVLLALPVDLLFCLSFIRSYLVVHTGFPSPFAWHPAHPHGPILNLELVLENQPPLLNYFTLKNILGILPRKSPNRTKPALLKPRSWSHYLTCHLLLRYWSPQFHGHCNKGWLLTFTSPASSSSFVSVFSSCLYQVQGVPH